MTAARIAAALAAVCVTVLTVDYVVARVRTPHDDQLIKTLQQQVKSDAGIAPRLDAEWKRITAYRQGRKRRDDITAWALIAAVSLFLLTAKRAPRSIPPEPTTASNLPARARRRPTALRPAADEKIDLAFVDDTVTRLGRGREAAIPILQALQTHYRYLPDEALRRVCEVTDITPAQIAGTSSFYAQFRRSPVGKHIVKVCHGTACHVAGARQISEELRRNLALAEGADTDPSRTFTIEEPACLGCCSLAPVLMVDERTTGKLTPASACDVLDAAADQQEFA